MVNLFYIDNNHVLGAQGLCDQHVRKSPGEIVEAAWDVVFALSLEVYEKATSDGIDFTYRKHRHSKGHMHPLPRWMALCRGNSLEALLRAREMCSEYSQRYGNTHNAFRDLEWLLKNPVNFNTSTWFQWLLKERQGVNGKKVPYSTWFEKYGRYCEKEVEGEMMYPWEGVSRNDTTKTTNFPQIMDDKGFPNCRTPFDPVTAGRKHYAMKAGAIIGGFQSPLRMKEPMKYFYRPPPSWLLEYGAEVQLHPKGKRKHAVLPASNERSLDTETKRRNFGRVK